MCAGASNVGRQLPQWCVWLSKSYVQITRDGSVAGNLLLQLLQLSARRGGNWLHKSFGILLLILVRGFEFLEGGKGARFSALPSSG